MEVRTVIINLTIIITLMITYYLNFQFQTINFIIIIQIYLCQYNINLYLITF